MVYESVVVVVVVSYGMCVDVLCSYLDVDFDWVYVIYNGIDIWVWVCCEWLDVVWVFGVDLDVLSVVFVGCIIC